MAVDIANWLLGLGLQQYEKAFRENDVDLEILPKLTVEDLTSIGIISVGHRRKLIEAIASLGSNRTTAVNPDIPTAPGKSAYRSYDAERRHLTVMFVDLVGSTALSGRLDPEDMRNVITRYQNTVAGVVTRFEGHVAKYMGDGVLCYFGWPNAHGSKVRGGACLQHTAFVMLCLWAMTNGPKSPAYKPPTKQRLRGL